MLRTSTGEIVEIGSTEGGFPLAIIPDSEYSITETTISAGDLFVLYTDGIFEAPTPTENSFRFSESPSC